MRYLILLCECKIWNLTAKYSPLSIQAFSINDKFSNSLGKKSLLELVIQMQWFCSLNRGFLSYIVLRLVLRYWLSWSQSWRVQAKGICSGWMSRNPDHQSYLLSELIGIKINVIILFWCLLLTQMDLLARRDEEGNILILVVNPSCGITTSVLCTLPQAITAPQE